MRSHPGRPWPTGPASGRASLARLRAADPPGVARTGVRSRVLYSSSFWTVIHPMYSDTLVHVPYLARTSLSPSVCLPDSSRPRRGQPSAGAEYKYILVDASTRYQYTYPVAIPHSKYLVQPLVSLRLYILLSSRSRRQAPLPPGHATHRLRPKACSVVSPPSESLSLSLSLSPAVGCLPMRGPLLTSPLSPPRSIPARTSYGRCETTAMYAVRMYYVHTM